MQFWMAFQILPLKMVLIQEFSFDLHFEIARTVYLSDMRIKVARFAIERKDLVALLEELLQAH